MSFHLPSAEHELLVYLCAHAPVTQDAELFAYQSAKEGVMQYVAALPCKEESSLQVVSTLGSISHHIFLTVTDSKTSHVAEVLADLESYDGLVTHLGFGHTAQFERKFMIEAGYSAILLLHPDVSNALEQMLPNEAQVSDDIVHFLFVVFLKESEYQLKKNQGLHALLNHFEQTNRGLTK